MAIHEWSEIRAGMSPERRARNAKKSREEIETYEQLRDLRKALEITQTQVAEKLGIDQSEVSRLERRTDIFIGTLRDYIHSLNGELEIFARLPHGRVRINAFDPDRQDALEPARL